jgi:phosphomannomutase
LGVGYGKLNKLVVNQIAYSFSRILRRRKKERQTIDVLVCSDGAPELKEFLKNISDVFYAQKQTVTAFKSYSGYDIKFVCRTINKLKITAGIYIERSIYNDNIFSIFFIDGNGNYFGEEFIEELKEDISKHDIFTIKSQTAKVDFLSNHRVVNDYVQKLLSLSNRKGDQRRTKIAISNYNNGVTDIIQKILGNMDFNYLINNKINKGNIHQSKNINDKVFTRFYRRDISFAKENKCDMLICPSKNGTELNLFVFNGRQVFHLDANEISLMFLNYFLIEVNISTKKLPNSYIGTDIPPIQSIQNLIKKYDLALSVSEDIKPDDDKFLLFY